MTLHYGYLFFPFVALWAELAAGRALLTTDPDMQSIIDDLQTALNKYNSVLKETSYLRDLPVLPCNESAARLEQSSTVVLRLSQYPVCVQKLGSVCPNSSALCQAITLNKDLLQHLGSSQDFTGCPPSSSPPPSDFDAIRKSVQCVDCWSQQVAALRS